MYRFKGQLDHALADFDQAITLDSASAIAYTNRANAYFELGRYVQAVADFEQAVVLAPRYANAYRGLAWLLATASASEIRDGRRAIKLARTAVKLEKNPSSLMVLAVGYAEFGQFEDAIMIQRQALSVFDRSAAIDEKLQQLLAAFQQGEAWREVRETRHVLAVVD